MKTEWTKMKLMKTRLVNSREIRTIMRTVMMMKIHMMMRKKVFHLKMCNNTMINTGSVAAQSLSGR